ncbi:MAG: 30S ribosomal protein S12 methylthiotransferase RimO [Acidimicrobiia bacterium]|nr:30S ribosomal protein S12 methylthiotransferase RimO [Acidimicrobiia bacterium]
MPRIHLTTLGCAKNQVDSDKLVSVMNASGYGTDALAEEADIVMINTCAFIEDAREESINTILEAERAKRPDAKLVVIGCLAQRYATELVESLPEVDAVVGLDRYGDLVGTLDDLSGIDVERPRGSSMDILFETSRPTPGTPYAYVKVAEGCDKPCTFCAIPLIRGAQRSRSPINIRQEMSELCDAGVGEIVLVAQDLAAYGRDIQAPGGITELLEFVGDVQGLRRLRLLYLYPKEIRPGLIEAMATTSSIAPYFDLSLQHASQPLLRAMKRPGSGESFAALIDDIRAASPTATTRSSFIVGFPGETGSQLEELADFLTAVRLDWAGFFPYSPEIGTPAAELEGQLPKDEIVERVRYLRNIQDEITQAANTDQVGRELEVVIDGIEDGQPFGRSYREAPEIDGLISLDRGEPGAWVTVEITGAYGTDLVGVVQ